MSPRRTRRGTIRESVIETTIDSSLKNTSKITKRSRRTNKSHAKASEDESDSPVETYSSIESLAPVSILNETSLKGNKRRKRGAEACESQDISLSVTIEEPKKINAKTPRNKKQTSKSKSQNKESEALSEGESAHLKTEKRVSYNLINDGEEYSGASSRKRAKSSKKGGKISEQSPNREASKNTTPDKNVTPKTSPALNVSITPSTPSRSRKTPRKSPVNLGSPKTHTPSPVKFLIKPRKLSIVDSPPSSENSSQQNISLDAGNESNQNTSKSSKSSKSNLNISSSKKKTISPFKHRPTFSKSPKIVLKTPKSKSKKSSPSKQKKSPLPSNKASKSHKSKDESLSVSENTSGLMSFNETITISPSKSTKKSVNTSTKSPPKSPKITSPAKSKLELLSSSFKSIPKVVLSSVSTKTHKSPNLAFPTKTKSSPKKASSTKSPASPKTKSMPKGMPKIVLVRKSPVRSPKKASPTKPKSSSRSKAKSPSKSKNSSNTSQESSEAPSPVEINLESTSQPDSSKKSKKSLSPSKSKKSPPKSLQTSLNVSSKKPLNTSLSSSKMPKIVLKKKSPLKSSKLATPASARKSLKVSSVIKSTPVSKANKVPVKQQPKKSSPTKNTSKNTTMSPKVVVSKLSSPELKNNSLRAKENQPSVTLVPLDHDTQKSRVSTGKSSKSPNLVVNKKSISPTKSVRSPKSLAKRSVSASGSKAGTPSGVLGNKFLNLKPKNTSTPRERSKATKLSPLGKSKIIKKLNDQSSIQTEQPFLEDESEPSLDDSSLIRMSDVFDVDTPQKNNTFEKNSSKTKSPKTEKLNNSDTFEVEKSPKNTSRRSNRSGTFEVMKSSPSDINKSKANNTYEVLEPKTPKFQNKSVKRTVNEAELGLDGEPSSKKSRKVNFASPARESSQVSSINRMGTPAHPRRTPVVSVSKTKTPLKAIVKGRLSSAGLANKTPVSTSLNKRSISVVDQSKSRRSNYDAQLASVNRLSRPKAVTDSQKKQETKTPVHRKIPNFAEIHQKNFAKMESLVDLKKRVEKRHVVLNAGSAKKATDSTNGAYNRFGFKMRKVEAVNIVTKKQTASVDSREQKRETARSALQGVRMNRRFELQMKARTKTS